MTLFHDVRYGIRSLRRSHSLAMMAVLSLALGIGANTAIFSLLDALILRNLPVPHPEQLVLFGPGDASGNSDNFPDDDMNLFSYDQYREFQQKNSVFSGVTAVNSFYNLVHGTVDDGRVMEPVAVQLVSGTFFNALGIHPVLGRMLTDADDQHLGGHPVAVISHGWWTQRFSRDPQVVGKSINLGDTAYVVVGVAAQEFSGTTVGQAPDIWVPLQMADQITQGPHKLNDRMYRSLNIFARLKPGVSREQASANVNLLLKQVLHGYAGVQPSRERLDDIQKAHITLNPGGNGVSPLLRSRFSKPLWMLMAVVGLALLIACANIANLLLARGATRQREIAVRVALGARRSRLIRQLLTESLLLALLGGALALALRLWGSRFLLTMVSSRSVHLDVSLDFRMLSFTVLISVATALLFGTLPALRATRVNLVPSLKEGRGQVSSSPGGIGKGLIVSQVALSLVLLVGAGLFLRSLVNLAAVDTGFNRQNVLLFRLDPRSTGITDDPRLVTMYQQVEQRVTSLPGVQAASFSVFNFNQGSWNEPAWVFGGKTIADDNSASYNAIGPGYFATMGMSLVAGRNLGPQDTATSPKVAVINQTMAQRFFPGASPVGKRFGMEGPEHSNDIEVVGVVRDAKYIMLDERPRAMAFYPYTQYLPEWGIGLYLPNLEVRFSGDSAAMVNAVRSAAAEINPRLPVADVSTLSQQVDASMTQQRLVAQLSIFFGMLAALLACIGIYGLTSYAVSLRISEIGIRMALGARRIDVMRMVMREVITLVTTGLLVGVPLVLISERWTRSLLFGLSPMDPVTIAAALLLLLLVATLAGFFPARRAARVDPMVALRNE
ncbi:MAG TPA: ABC transporter permease [Candidatus Angelobacter sp.]